jgi:hypothetical protein
MRTEFATELAIVLTGAITVGVDFVAVADPAERRREYLEALKFYRAFAPVYFIENSNYDLSGDPDFANIPGVRLRRFLPLPTGKRGKGYQEFLALDRWYDTEIERPRRILKITGRYLIDNISAILGECRRVADDVILIDQYARDQSAHTSLFSMSWPTYGKRVYGLYNESDDQAGVWIEHVLYKSLRSHRSECEIFGHEPRITGVSGSTGGTLSNSLPRWTAKQALRSVNRSFDRSQLYWRGGLTHSHPVQRDNAID